MFSEKEEYAFIPSSSVVKFIGELKGPTPIRVAAATLKIYSTCSSKFVSVWPVVFMSTLMSGM